MNRGLYLAALGMRVDVARQDIRANNLANMSTPGFARQLEVMSTFQPQVQSGTSLQGPMASLQMPAQLGTFTDLSRGNFEQTDNPLDVTVVGDGFIQVGQGSDTRYVRTASLRLENGKLLTADGRQVMGQTSPLAVTGTVTALTFGKQGEVMVGGRTVDRMRVVNLGTTGSWVPAGDSGLVPVGAVPTVVPAPDVESGVLEQSNVNGITEMVDMISLYRHFEAGQKSVHSIDETLEKAVTEVGTARA